MTIKASGAPLAMTEIGAEFGLTNASAISLNQFYRGGALVPNGSTANANIPTSGTISFNNMYGATKVLVITLTASTTNYNLLTAIQNQYGSLTGAVNVALNIQSGVTIGSTGAWALDIGQFPSGSIITINNSGSIQGMAGTGGTYFNAGGAGQNCINASYANQTVTINNSSSGIIYAGGGGGGSGGPGGTGGQGGTGYYQYWGAEQYNSSDNNTCWCYDTHYGTTQGYYGGGQVFNVGGQPTQYGSYLRGSYRQDYYGSYGVGTGEDSYSVSYPINYYAISQLQGAYVGGAGGGGGGVGGAGGHGTGYNTSAVGGAGGAAGAGGGNNGGNSGTGGQGGTGGTGGAGGGWGAYGANGATGATGNTGAGGNAGGGGGGYAGGGGASGGAPGYYLYRNGATCTLNNSGNVAGLLS